MSRILVIAEHDGRQLSPATAKTLRCAQDIGGEITVAVWGAGIGAIAAAAARLAGVSRVLAFDDAANTHALAAAMAPQLLAAARDSSHLLAPSTTFGKDLLPRLAALLEVPAISDVMAVESPTRFRRPIYAGNAILTVEAGDLKPIAATVRIASYAAVGEQDQAAPVEAAATQPAAPSHTRFVSLAAQGGDRPDLQSARRVVSGGRALGSAEKFALVQELADVLGAAVGASRAAVDAGYAANDLQVGQTGKIIAPELYIALGISGAIQHMTGIKDARTIVAVNKDQDAPIFEVADYGLVADLFEAVPALIAGLKNRA
ncbi:MAG: electron transfer flavoprotein subunit alpha/FixB family protein [Pseudomonadota bacterium]|nr:electron transfer flavoprotein subunit alpha/FixB family protein [Pseudomonadota bacterium]